MGMYVCMYVCILKKKYGWPLNNKGVNLGLI